MRLVTLLDTSISTDNLGDEIIMDAVQGVLHALMPDAYIYRVPTHDYLGTVSRRLLKQSELSIVGGTNILSSRMGRRTELWKLMPWDVNAFGHAILLGVGWRDYMKRPSWYSRWLLRHLLSKEYVHSARDTYTMEKLSHLDHRALNTACPTMWSLTEEHCRDIPTSKAQDVVTTLTYYRPDPESDRALLFALARNYRRIYFWPQQSRDLPYFQSLGVPGITIIQPSVRHYNQILENESVDFVGTRLHGGIRALQKGRRALIVMVDNRAAEIGKDTGLPVIERSYIHCIDTWINGSPKLALNLPQSAIARWKAQFGEDLTKRHNVSK